MKLCVPSYLVPGTWLENLEAMRARAWMEGVELLFFAWDEDARRILGREREGIEALAGRFEFSLHLPDPLGARDEELVEQTEGFVGLYVLHPPTSGVSDWAGLVEGLRSRHGDRFLLEYTGPEAFAAAEAALPGLPLCADTGRLLRDGLPPAPWIAERAGRVREIHLHGLAGPRDHAVLREGEPWLQELCPFLSGFTGRVELEVFSLAGVEESRSALERTRARPLSSACARGGSA
jgi:sugar phosphate isomerase/epimerase